MGRNRHGFFSSNFITSLPNTDRVHPPCHKALTNSKKDHIKSWSVTVYWLWAPCHALPMWRLLPKGLRQKRHFQLSTQLLPPFLLRETWLISPPKCLSNTWDIDPNPISRGRCWYRLGLNESSWAHSPCWSLVQEHKNSGLSSSNY